MTRFEGVYVAVLTPFTEAKEVDYGLLREHTEWLVENGAHGLIPNGSVGEYASLSDDERRRTVETIAEAADGRVPLLVGVAAPASHKAREWTRHAADAGASGVMALPPINYNPTRREIIAHYEGISREGLPIVAYNNPFDTRVDLTPDLLAEVSRVENVVAVKEFTGDVRRVPEILEKTSLEVMCGSDDIVLESFLMGATGWVAGFPNVFPKECADLFELAQAGKFEEARELYRRLLPLFRWDSGPRLVQAMKYSLELLGRPFGGTRPPRLPMDEADRRGVEEAFAHARGTKVGA